jgi:hypothetical protein
VCPREYFSGRAIDATTDLASTFLERVEVHQKTTNDMRMRTRPAVALVSTGNVYGSWKCLYLDTLKVGTMDAWTAMPMDNGTVRYLNELSARDSTPLDTDLEFKIGDRVISVNEEDHPDDLADLYKAYGRRELLRTPGTAADYDPTEPMPAQAVEIDDGTRASRGVLPTRAAQDAVIEADDIEVVSPSGPSAGDMISAREPTPTANESPMCATELPRPPEPRAGAIEHEEADDDESVHVAEDNDELDVADTGESNEAAGDRDIGEEDVVDDSDEESLAAEGRPPPRVRVEQSSGRVLRPRRYDWKSGHGKPASTRRDFTLLCDRRCRSSRSPRLLRCVRRLGPYFVRV